MSRGNVTCCWRTLLLNFTVKDCQERDCGEGKTRGDVGKQIHGRTFHTRQHNTNNTRSHTRSTDIGGSARRDDTPKRKSSLKQGVGHKKARFRSALAETWHENVKLGALTVVGDSKFGGIHMRSVRLRRDSVLGATRGESGADSTISSSVLSAPKRIPISLSGII